MSRKVWTYPPVGIEKNMFGKLVIAVNSVGHSIRILNERAAGD